MADPAAPTSADSVAAILAELRERIQAAPPTGEQGADGAEPFCLAAREEADRFWAVTADLPYASRPGTWGRIRGLVLTPVKTLLRKLMRWYVEPVAIQQREFNAAALRTIDELAARTREGLAHLERLQAELTGRTEERTSAATEAVEEIRRSHAERARLLEELDERLTLAERRSRAQVRPAPAAAAAPAPAPQEFSLPDYFAFETHMREPAPVIRERQRHYVDEFREAGPVLDIGCGRGEFLALLREAGVEARGVDVDADMVAFGRGEGLDVEQQDALAYLEALDDGSLGGIFCAHVVEHFPPAVLVRLLELAAAKLRPGGIFVAETPNPTSLISLATFFADLTHVRPLHPETFAFLARHAGFRQVELRFLNEPPPEGRLQPVRLPDDPSLEAARDALQRNVDRVNEVVFGAQDYALVART